LVLDGLERQEKFEHDTKFDECLRRICSTEVKEDHETHCAVRSEHPGSTDWILESEKVSSWKDTDCPPLSILWLNGIPGAGKSTDDSPADIITLTNLFQARRSWHLP
jgi:hypothetical protein